MTEQVKKTMSFPVAMRDFFGLRKGQVLKDFAAELRQLDEATRKEFRAGLEQNGYIIT